MDSEGLQTFILLANLKNFTRTAERLYVSQSTVTNRIAELEAETGKKLFVRGQGGAELTEEGKLFLSYARRIRELEESFIREVNASSRFSEQLRVGAINAVYESDLFPLLAGFFAERRDVALNVVLGHSLDLLRMLQDNIIDVAFTYLPLNKTEFLSERFSSDRLVLLVAPSRNEYKNGIRKAELAACEYLMCNFAFGEAGEFVRSLFPPRHAFRFEIDNSGKVAEYLLGGYGYSFLPEKMAAAHIASGRLQVVRPLDFAVPELVCYRTQRRGNALAEAFARGAAKNTSGGKEDGQSGLV